MKHNFKKILSKTLENEGGYVNDPDDNGGETNYGITVKVAKDYGYFGNMKNIQMITVNRIYQDNYWKRIRGNDINSYKLASNIFDMSVNSGVSRSIKLLQKVLNEKYNYDLRIDGIIGKATIRVVNTISSINEESINKEYTNERKQFYKRISLKGNNYKYLKGWLNRANKY